jgi:cysteine-rich repeat protein
MKIVVSRPVGLVGLLLLAAGCGGSGNGLAGAPDGSLEASAPGSDGGGITPIADSGGTSEDAPTTSSDGAAVCGDGVVEGNEECDDGTSNGSVGDPCTTSCQWVCIQGNPTRGDSACNTSGNACLGTATCQANHTCQPGTPLPTGTSCGTGEICNNQLCAQAVCGDGIVTPPEECDDGSNNGTAGDGCTKSCTFVCLSTDPTRNCTPSDPCAGQGTCNDTTHVCTAGTPEGNGTICAGESSDGGVLDAGPDADAGGIEVCKAATCVPGYCGDGVLEPGEQCDFGSGNGAGTGCETDCKFSCTKSPNSCTQPTDTCAGTNACTNVVVNGDTGQHCVQGSPLANGTTCGTGGTCQGGICQTATCGNGVIDPGEQCDFGAGNNVAGSGCNPDCQFSCQKTPTDTCQTNVCTADPTVCTTVTGPNSTAGQKCDATTELAACGDCSSTGVCVNNQCAKSICGDGCVDPRTGETCDPPNGTTCDSSCHLIVCGDGKREGLEQCDDGNTVNLDGCDSKCLFEQDHRATSVTIEYTPSSPFCPHDALGGAIAGAAQSTLSSDLSSSVASGATSIEFKFMGITDLTGTAQTTGLALGALSGTPAAAPSGVTYSGTNDTDWWYTTAATTIDAERNPLSQTPATFAAKVLSAKNGSLSITISIAGQPATLSITDASIQANVGATSTPTESTTGKTPGHLASENLEPTLVSFGSMNNGLLCGNISAASLATVPVPSALQTGTTACSNVTFGAANSLLDVLVTGCSTLGGFIAIINKTQPDQVTNAPAAGAGPGYTLGTNSNNVVSTCTDHTGASVNLTQCLAAAAYSSYFGFATDRIIAK